MHNIRKSSVALALVITACGGGGNGGTPPPPTAVFTSLTISPTNPTMVDGDTVQLTATPRDQNNAPMSGLPAATFTLTQGTSVIVSPTGRVIAQQPGASTITASLTSGGTTRTATTSPTVNPLGNANVTASGTGQTFDPSTVKIATSGQVTWSFPGPEIHNVTFDGPAPTGGNIPDRSGGTTESRTFPNAGQYEYRCTRHGGMTGTVVVRTP